MNDTKQEALQKLANYLKPHINPNAIIKPLDDPSELSPVEWLKKFFPKYVFADFADFHLELLDWVFNITRNTQPEPFVAIWPRGSAKSTIAELACARINAAKSRKYIVYVCATQDRADDHLSNISNMFESATYAKYYPDAAGRRLSKYGSSKGWRRNRLMTGSGLTIDALGLDVSVRGAKIDEDRPDLFIFDDLDDVEDSTKETTSKLTTITKKILPAGGNTVTVLAVQNLILETGIFANLIEKPKFLTNRILSGPIPALKNFEYVNTSDGAIITSGVPTWEYMNIPRCQAEINKEGITAFLTEFQHDVNAGKHGLFKDVIFKYLNESELPDLLKVVTWCDPAVTDNDDSDAHGIQIDGVDTDGKIYRLYSWEEKASPRETLIHAINMSVKYKSIHIGIETNQGGDLWEETYNRIIQDLKVSPIAFTQEKAGVQTGNKVHRASLMLASYQRGEIIHVINEYESHLILEKALNRFPDRKPFDLVDAAYWAWNDVSLVPVASEGFTNNTNLQERNSKITPLFGRESHRLFENKERKSMNLNISGRH